MKKAFVFLVFVISALYFQFTGSGCANIIPPQGGPRDSLPPAVVSALPLDSTVNFTGNRITISFDEYIDLQDVQNNLLFTPTFETNPTIDVRLRTMTIKLRDSLEPNTTYIFNFGNAIKDVNEGNVLRDFVYTFSTGPALDSLELSGKVLLAENGRTDSTLIVVLHRDLDDSAVVNQRPRYITRVNARGEFRFRNLPPGKFAIYALGDAGLSRRYLSKAQTFAFADSPVVVASGAAPITLYAYKERASTSSVTAGIGTNTRVNPNDRRLKFTTNLVAGQLDLLKQLVITFEQKLKFLDTSKVMLASDTTFKPEPFSIRLDSTRKIATVTSSWREASLYHLLVDKDFAEDSTGKKLLKSDTLSFTTKKRSEYGSLQVRLKNGHNLKNPVLLLFQNGVLVYSSSLAGILNEELFLPGEYEVRILDDLNGNGKWDPGQFLPSRRQPEIVRPIERRIVVRPAWKNEFELAL